MLPYNIQIQNELIRELYTPAILAAMLSWILCILIIGRRKKEDPFWELKG
jgi:hypothetical protein